MQNFEESTSSLLSPYAKKLDPSISPCVISTTTEGLFTIPNLPALNGPSRQTKIPPQET